MPTGARRSLLTSSEACALLDVKRPTLYSYVSRGLIRAVHEPGVKRRMYVADDVHRVAARSAARRGHAPVAAGALRWGEPVLDTSISAVGEAGFLYRGRSVPELVARGASFEEVADLLWQSPPSEPWPAGERPADAAAGPVLVRLIARVAAWTARTPGLAGAAVEGGDGGSERGEARRLLGACASALAPGQERRAGTMAQRVARTWGLPASAAPALDAALVLMGDHELNASTFAARVAASTGAPLGACVGAALYAFSGPRHGGACARVEALVDGLPRRPAALRGELRARLERGDPVPEFGHRLYPDGDPRSGPLLAMAAAHAVDGAALARVEQVIAALAELTGQRPSVDYALVALSRSLGLPAGAATGLFALGRAAGWIAHAFEQRESSSLLRPRARYVGPGAAGGGG